MAAIAPGTALIDGFGRRITYVRLSVTDRRDLRCRYCMAEQMRFLPKRDILTLEEMEALAVYGCLGHDQKVELRDLIRAGGREAVDAALDQLLAGKPKGHDFRIAAAAPPAVARHMSVTGG